MILKDLRNIELKSTFGNMNGICSYFISDRKLEGAFNSAEW